MNACTLHTHTERKRSYLTPFAVARRRTRYTSLLWIQCSIFIIFLRSARECEYRVHAFGYQFYDLFIARILFVFVYIRCQLNSISFVNVSVRSIKVIVIDNYNTKHKLCASTSHAVYSKQKECARTWCPRGETALFSLHFVCIDSMVANRHDRSILLLFYDYYRLSRC